MTENFDEGIPPILKGEDAHENWRDLMRTPDPSICGWGMRAVQFLMRKVP
jgi:hypothetical protein